MLTSFFSIIIQMKFCQPDLKKATQEVAFRICAAIGAKPVRLCLIEQSCLTSTRME